MSKTGFPSQGENLRNKCEQLIGAREQVDDGNTEHVQAIVDFCLEQIALLFTQHHSSKEVAVLAVTDRHSPVGAVVITLPHDQTRTLVQIEIDHLVNAQTAVRRMEQQGRNF